MLCHNCGKEIEEKWTVCPYCGESLKKITMEEKGDEKSSDVKKTKTSRGQIMAVVVLMIVTIGLAVGVGEDSVYDLSDEAGYNETDYKTPLEKLREKANWEGCTSNIITDEYWVDAGPEYDYLATEVADDGSYFDEVVLGAWYDEMGEPIAGGLPNELGLAVAKYNLKNTGSKASSLLKRFHFIDGQMFTMDMLKRKSTNDFALYAIVLTDISKRTNSSGNPCFEGWDYVSWTPVIIHCDFSGILNGDDLLVFGEYTGLGSDDTPNFRGIWIENINGRGLD